MKKLLTLALVAALVPALVHAQGQGQGKGKGKGQGQKPINGEIVSVDLTARTFVLRQEAEEEETEAGETEPAAAIVYTTVAVTPETTIAHKQGQAMALADIVSRLDRVQAEDPDDGVPASVVPAAPVAADATTIEAKSITVKGRPPEPGRPPGKDRPPGKGKSSEKGRPPRSR